MVLSRDVVVGECIEVANQAFTKWLRFRARIERSLMGPRSFYQGGVSSRQKSWGDVAVPPPD